MAGSSLSPLFSFQGDAAQASLDAWERIDDVIMGGVSSSRLVKLPDGSGASFEGRIRSEGGGFCGQRMRLLSESLDLSDADGLYVECEVGDVGIDASKRVWKMTMRTKQDRGEVVYQSAFKPPQSGRQAIKLPFESFRLVRGPRLVPGVPPLTAAQTNETFQVSLVVSKFEVSEEGSALPQFIEGPFALKVFEVGTFGGGAAAGAAAAAAAAALPKPLTKEEQAAAAPPMVKLLRPLLGLLFGETTRRRRAATKLLEARGSSRLARAKLAWAWRAGTAGWLVALQRSVAVTVQDASAAALTIPIRLLFKAVVLTSRTVKLVKRTLTGGKEDGPKLPPLTPVKE